MESLFLIGTAQGLFLSLLLISKKGKKIYDYFLLFFILLFTIRLLFFHFREVGFYDTNPWLIIIEFIYWPLFGPVLYLYIDLISCKVSKINWKHLIHFVPMLLVLIGFFDYLKIAGTTFHEDYRNDSVVYNISKYFWYFTTHVYFILCVFKLHSYRKSLKHHFSYMENVDLKWLMILTYGFGVFIFASLILILTNNYLTIVSKPFGEEVVWLIKVVYLFGIGYYGYKQKGVFNQAESSPMDDLQRVKSKVSKPTPSYTKSRISDNEMQEVAEKLVSIMNKQQVFLEPSLDIRILAERLETNQHKISQALNLKLGKNFYEFVNEYRIEYAKKCLVSPKYQNEKMMSIAYDSGFNSKTSFFTAFKKYVHITPADYKKKFA